MVSSVMIKKIIKEKNKHLQELQKMNAQFCTPNMTANSCLKQSHCIFPFVCKMCEKSMVAEEDKCSATNTIQ